MKLFERVCQELVALGFDPAIDDPYYEGEVDNFEATKDGVEYSFAHDWKAWELYGPNSLFWSTQEGSGTITFNSSDDPGNGVWEEDK